MQEQTYPTQRTDPKALPSADDVRDRQEWKRQLDRMLDEYRSQFVLRDNPPGENVAGSEFEGG